MRPYIHCCSLAWLGATVAGNALVGTYIIVHVSDDANDLCVHHIAVAGD